MPPGDWPAVEAAWEQARLLAQTRRATATRGATLESDGAVRCTCSRSRPWPAAV